MAETFNDGLYPMTEDKKRRKKKKPYNSVTFDAGNIDYNIKRFNSRWGNNVFDHSYLNGTINPGTETSSSEAASETSGEGIGESLIDEANNGSVKKYYVRPQNVYCSTKKDVLKVLISAGDRNCSVYSLRRLPDKDKVNLLTSDDIIYYYDDNVLYDKNHVQVVDYNLSPRKEEGRRKFTDIDAVPISSVEKEYTDRLTDFNADDKAVKEDLADKGFFNQDFKLIENAFGQRLDESGMPLDNVCCICGQEFSGYGNNPEPYMPAEDANGNRQVCCDSCNQHFVLPARLAQRIVKDNGSFLDEENIKPVEKLDASFKPTMFFNRGDLTEDTVRRGRRWLNKGKAGSHGYFRTKKAADRQRRARFANGYKINETVDDVASLTDFKSFPLTEKIEKHDTLNPKLWDIETNKLLPDVRKKIMEIVNAFLNQLKEDGIKIISDDIVLIGSNAGYNYNAASDLDIHIVADIDALDCPDDLYPLLYSAYRSIFNSKYKITLHGVPVEVYVETAGTPRISGAVYSVKQDDWIKEPKQEEVPEIDSNEFMAIFKVWQDKVKDILAAGDDLTDEDPVVDLINNIYKLRQDGLKTKAGEFSLKNLVFKEIRALGELDRLKELRDKLVAKRLSLESLKPDSFDAE